MKFFKKLTASFALAAGVFGATGAQATVYNCFDDATGEYRICAAEKVSDRADGSPVTERKQLFSFSKKEDGLQPYNRVSAPAEGWAIHAKTNEVCSLEGAGLILNATGGRKAFFFDKIKCGK